MVLTEKEQHVVAAFDAFVDALKQAETLEDEIKQTLINLKTRANIEKELPEALPFLPTSTTTALAVNTDLLRAKLAEFQKQKAGDGVSEDTAQ